MSAVLEQLNLEVGEVVDKVRRSLVQVHNGRRGTGSGAIWHGDGLIVTNAHVVSGRGRRQGPRRELRVTLPDGTTHPARLLARDDGLDVAALLVEAEELTPQELTPIELGTSRDLQPGQWVLAVGYPWGVAGAATAGIVIGAGEDLPETPLTGSGVDRRQSRIEARSLGRTTGGRPWPVGGSQHHDGRP